ncbi:MULTISPECIES: 16S rRNA (cytosine(967)-C(5))-methyltransferase RsmB [Clostridia]|uniref:16S rRNA (cytosine(967)-C(5))-methyltransferase RsmB n=1 Tax=Clostridia TaxID=186801 RepID=UPI000EA30092|nr:MULTISPECIES: 16S rRNA (cytosine(967)-C(5))-methyltransferase RsmB [Clostridia]NBJ68453.1 16S rRNA (cytosine(967)-C(5))-methyltransferase RsmB [Roseburia sp. 1XD42-34]RKI81214.1 16S rRNA (cytosine(967)-C(5))-methyltransferase RsmB [Clostridium sp. 1xD42-85]
MNKQTVRSKVLNTLIRIEKDQGYSHLLVNQELQAGGIRSKDEGLFTEIVYGTIQQQLTLDYYLKPFLKGKTKLDLWVRVLLRMSIYQMVYLDRIPDHAIIHEAVEIAKSRGHKGIASFINGILRAIQRKGVPPISEISDDVARISIATSHPQWLVERWMKQYGKETTEAICLANTKHKPLSVRIHPLKISRKDAIRQMEESGFKVRPSFFSPQGIVIEKGNVLKSKWFKEGMVTVQDQSSMLVAEIMQLKPGMYVLDACSAPGGKATHIAEKMENQGRIDAYDLHAKKVKLIQSKADELDLSIIHPATSDARKLREKYQDATFDRILIDAPCSGLGVIRGKPEIKYHKREQDIERLASIQQEILETVAPLLKQEGRLVYSTCTVDQQENEQVIRAFCEKHPSFEVDQTFFTALPKPLHDTEGISKEGLQIFPQTFQTDGFFLTRLKLKNG